MNENKGSKGGSRDLRIQRFFLNFFKKKEKVKLEEDKQIEETEQKKKKELVEISEYVVTLPNKNEKKVTKLDTKTVGVISKKVSVDIPKKVEEPLKQDKVKKEVKQVKEIQEEKNNHELKNKQVDRPIKPKADAKPKQQLEEVVLFKEISDKKRKNQVENKEQKEELDSVKSTPGAGLEEKELKEVILEQKLLQTLEETIKFNEYKVKKILVEKEQLEESVDDLLLKRDCEDTLEKIEELLMQIKKLKQELESIIASSNFDKVYEWDDNYFSLLIDEYKNKFNNDFDLELLTNVQKNESYKQLMGRIIEIEDVTNKLDAKMNEKLGDITRRDKDFLGLSNEVDYIDKDFDSVDKMIDDMDKVLKDLDEKVNSAKKVTEQVSYITHEVNHTLDNLLLTYLVTKNNPLVPKTVGLLLRTQAVFAFIGDLLTPKREKIVSKKVEIIDYTNEIKNGLKSLDDVFKLCDDTCLKIKNIKQDFEKQFSSYDIPEYREVFDKLNSLEKNIEERRHYLLASEKEFTKQLDKNKILIKEKETHEIH